MHLEWVNERNASAGRAGEGDVNFVEFANGESTGLRGKHVEAAVVEDAG